MLDGILEKYTKYTLLEELIYDIINNDLTLKFAEPKLDEIGWKVVQILEIHGV